MKNLLIPMFVLAMALTGCTQDETVLPPKENSENVNRIESMVAGFVSSTRGDMETGNIEIVSVTTKYFDESGEEVVSGARTRGGDSECVFPLSTVVFTNITHLPELDMNSRINSIMSM